MTPVPGRRDRLLAWWWRRRWRGYLTIRRLFPGSHQDGTLLFRTRYGSAFLLDPLSYVDGIVVAEGYYESEVLAAMQQRLRPSAVLWDIGANFGLHAVTAAALVPDATVVAFEPNPAEHARLLRHRAWNAPHLVTSAIALSDASATLPLHLGPPGNSGMTTLAPWSEAKYEGTVLVAASAGDGLIASGALPAPTLIKLDVEGYEAAVLRGLPAALRDSRCNLVVFEDGPATDTEAKQLLRQAGFGIKPLSRQEDSAHALANFVAEKPSAA